MRWIVVWCALGVADAAAQDTGGPTFSSDSGPSSPGWDTYTGETYWTPDTAVGPNTETGEVTDTGGVPDPGTTSTPTEPTDPEAELPDTGGGGGTATEAEGDTADSGGVKESCGCASGHGPTQGLLGLALLGLLLPLRRSSVA
jgi:MYXO-CTERM domain-containing protein